MLFYSLMLPSLWTLGNIHSKKKHFKNKDKCKENYAQKSHRKEWFVLSAKDRGHMGVQRQQVPCLEDCQRKCIPNTASKIVPCPPFKYHHSSRFFPLADSDPPTVKECDWVTLGYLPSFSLVYLIYLSLLVDKRGRGELHMLP